MELDDDPLVEEELELEALEGRAEELDELEGRAEELEESLIGKRRENGKEEGGMEDQKSIPGTFAEKSSVNSNQKFDLAVQSLL